LSIWFTWATIFVHRVASCIDMRNTGGRLAFGFLLLACSALAATAEQKADVTVRVAVDKATVIAFLPPSMRNSRDYDSTAARDYVSEAMAGAKACLGKDYASYRVVFADRIVIRSQGHEQAYETRTVAPLVGALLFGPGAPNARILFAGGGPEALSRMLRSAASEYFERRCGG